MEYKKKNSLLIRFVGKIIWLFIVITLTIVLYDLYRNINVEKIEYSENNQLNSVQASENNIDKYEAIEMVSSFVVGISKLKSTNINFFSLNATENYNLGTGVIVSKKGYVLSNYHITGKKYSKCYISMKNDDEFEAEVVWVDEDLDLSILKINTFREMESSILGDSDLIKVGADVYAIGNPLGTEFQRTVTKGIISALNRTIKIEDERKAYMEDLIQTDASINSGNSGGPLINENGEVIGITTIKINDAEGIGFAVPINIVKPIIESYENNGEFNEVNLGLHVYDKEAIKYLNSNLSIEKGVYVEDIDKNSIAQKNGIQVGDIIVKIDEKEIKKINDVKSYIYTKQKGDEIRIKVIRNKKEEEIIIKL